MVQLTDVQSSVIAAHGYDAATQTLAIKFRGGNVYHYRDVPIDVAAAFANAESVGRAYTSMIREQYAGEMVVGRSEGGEEEA